MKNSKFKKIFSSVLAYALCLALVISIQPLGAFAMEYTAGNTVAVSQSDEITTADNEASEPYIIKEIESKRDANTKHFLLSDGTYLATTYDVPVHYKDASGAWQQYDNSLEENPSHSEELINKKSDTAVSLSKKAKSNKMVSISSSGYEISWGFDKKRC